MKKWQVMLCAAVLMYAQSNNGMVQAVASPSNVWGYIADFLPRSIKFLANTHWGTGILFAYCAMIQYKKAYTLKMLGAMHRNKKPVSKPKIKLTRLMAAVPLTLIAKVHMKIISKILEGQQHWLAKGLGIATAVLCAVKLDEQIKMAADTISLR